MEARKEINTRKRNLLPMIPIITVIASYHGTAIIRFVASRTDPDLVSPFIYNLG